ncbi:hypothetical protein HOLleu_18345 [Holothuria leucospilota]|uniref:SAM domain-containing protein n=1 Tax=Holothuria leucospilota TaxID=206669 RepID=A0A9Q1H9D6_HOLLE|nr:hypothetical protein HOLleu_18345 [Holothuria leucospilota]
MNSYLSHLKRAHRERNVANDELHAFDGAIHNLNPFPEAEVNEHMSDSDGDMDNEENIPVHEFDENTVKTLAANLVVKMRCSTSVPMSVVGEVIDETNNLFHHSMSQLNLKLTDLFQNHNVNTDAPDVREIFGLLELLQNPFNGLETPKQQMHYMINDMQLVSPTEVALGVRYDQVIDHRTGQNIQKMVTDTFQYISVLEVLKLVLNVKVCNVIASETRCEKGIASYRDGVQYFQHGIFKNHPHALRIHLFYDDVEVVNPIGSKTSIHKLGMFYYSIDNLPRRYNSVMSSIHVLTICYAMDLKKYGFNPILRLFLDEMRQLESDGGYSIELNRERVQIHGTLTSLSADTLAAHDILGFLGPSANRFCRLCLAKREEIQTKFSEEEFVLRSIKQHDEHAEAASTQRLGDPASGVRTTCLNELRHFHCATNYNLDVMHDMLEGVCPFEVKLLLHYFIYDAQFVSLETVNQRIKAFNYGFCDRKNKPSQLLATRMRNQADHKLGQKAAQMWCLTRMLPLLIGDKIPVGDGHYEILLLLLQYNDVEFEVLKTMTEQDFKEIGVMSFGLRRKLTIAVKKLTGSQEAEEKEHQKSCKECVQEHPQGKDILCRLEDGKHLTTLQRRLFVRIQTANLISKWGLYPTSAQKQKLARDIVQTFPTLKDTTPGMEGHEIFYHQGNGFIEYRLKTVRAGSPLSSKKRKHSVFEPGPSEEVEENSAAVIEKVCTHFIDVEFQMMYPDNHSGFLSKWECYYAPRILEIAKEEYPAIAAIISNFEGGDRNLCAAVLLGHILYRCSSKKSQSVAASRAEAIKFFIQSVPIGTDVAEAAKKKDTKYQQPFLLGMGPETKPNQFFMEIFYHQGNGFIEYRLKTVRAGSPLSSKKRKHSVLEPGPSEEVEENSAGVIEKVCTHFIHEMKYTPPPSSKENTKRIVALFKETHRHRRQWSLRTSVDITTFLQEYPRLQDMPQLIDVEFQMMYPDNHSGFLSKWECYYAPRILEIAKEEYPAIAAIISNFEGGDRNLCAAILLGHILYRCSSKKSQSVAASRAEAIKFFIQSVPIGTDIAEAAKKKDTKYQQPFLLGMGPETKPNQFFYGTGQTISSCGTGNSHCH